MILELLAVASALSSIGGNIARGRAARRGANASVAEGERLADDAIARGEELARRYNLDLAQLIGRQRVAGAAQGLDLSQGSLAAIQSDTARIGALDVETIRENARREAFGLRQAGKNQALALRSQATSQYAQAFANVLDFGANAWAYQNRRASRVPSYNNFASHQTARAWRPASLTP
jgi:hypothetical protein